MPDSSEHTQNSLSEQKTNHWLQRLKDESWEAELLVSAIAIFGSFQLFKVVDWATNFFIDKLPANQYMIGYFIVFMGLLAVSILVSMFVIHFFLRAYWVGLVGLNSVYPEYGLEDSAYSKIYTEKILSILPKLKDSLTKVDRLCSVIFSAAFCLLLIYLYGSIMASVYLIVFNMLSKYIPEYILLIPAYFIALVYIIQSIFTIISNLKKFKDNEKVQTLAFKVVKFASILMFGPLYKSLLQITMTFGSNFKKDKALVRLLLLFILSGMMVSVIQIRNTNIPYLISQDNMFNATQTYSGYYQTENESNNFLLSPEIASDIIQSNTTRLFIPIFSHDEKFEEKVCKDPEIDENASELQQRMQKKTQYLECLSTYNKVFLNNKELNIDFLKYNHPKTNQFGVIGYVPLDIAKKGNNTITVKKAFEGEVFSEWNIPFYYSPK
ncbi:MAG: hypothetical protein AB8B59_10620 [Maribacter sp.]